MAPKPPTFGRGAPRRVLAATLTESRAATRKGGALYAEPTRSMTEDNA
jgi:hypothetical protein